MWKDKIKLNKDGLIPVITQEKDTNNILMFAWMNLESLSKTIELKQAVYFSRSRNKLWLKGEESGNIQIVDKIYLDCDNDVILLTVIQKNNIACHTGRKSCFYQIFDFNKNNFIDDLNNPVLKENIYIN